MKKCLLITFLFFAAMPFIAHAQEQSDTLYVSHNGTSFRLGQKISLGLGSSPDGYFQYIYMMDVILGTAQLQKHLGSEYATKEFTILKIKYEHQNMFSKKSPIKNVYLQINSGDFDTKYVVAIEPALLAKEVLVTSQTAH